MKNLFFIYLAIVSLGMMTLVSCGDDENAVDPNAPVLTVAGSTSAEVATGTFAEFDIAGAVGKRDLKTLTITKNGSIADFSEVTIDGNSISGNPILLLNADVSGFTGWTIGFLAPATAGETDTYVVTLEDEKGLTDSETFEISTPAVTTSLDLEFDREPGSNFYSVEAATDKVSVRFNATQGSSSPLATISITRNNVLVDNSDLFWPDADGTANNPYTLVDGEKAGFNDFTISFQTPPSSATTYSYTITLEDESGASTSLSLDVDRLQDLSGPFTGQFYHMAGAAGCTGGYDLVNDADVSSSGSSANRDMLNTDMGSETFSGSWAAQNDTRYVLSTSGLQIDDTKGNAESVYATGNPLASINNPSVGQIYVAKLRGGTDYAIIRIDAIDTNFNCASSGTSGNKGKIEFTYYKG